MNSAQGAAIMLVAIMVVGLLLALSADIRESNIKEDCDNFGAVELYDEIYECAPAQTKQRSDG